MSEWVAYYRVSTSRQGQSGLGLDAQRQAVRAFVAGRAGRLVEEHSEAESGRKTQRKALQAALAACRLYRARLVVAVLDRLARNAAFLHQLRESGIGFTCVDMPDANELTVAILAAVAEDEAKRGSTRTRLALAQAKLRGVQLGGTRRASAPELDEMRIKSALVRAQNSSAFRARVLNLVRELKEELGSANAVAQRLRQDGLVKLPRGSTNWTACAVRRVLAN